MPIYWKPSRAAVAGHRQPIQWPRYSEKLDYEFELGLYIGKRGKNIPVERAHEHIAGYTVFNDLGLRDIQPAEMSLRLGPTKSKDFETSKVMGPCLVTADELPSVESLMAPAATPPKIIAAAHAAVVKVLANPNTQKRLADLGFIAVGDKPEEFSAHVKAQVEALRPIVRELPSP
jgi:hypothetical protein